MSNPTSFRSPTSFGDNVDPKVARAINFHDAAITDLQQAIPALKSQITALQSSTTTATTGTPSTVTASSSEVVIPTSNVIGGVNNQSGNVTYTTQQSDYGGFVVLNDASAIAVTLATAPSIQVPWYFTVINAGIGLATLTAATGTITGGSTVAGGQSATVVFDGANFDIVLFAQPPQSIAPVAGEYLTGYSAGVFSQSTPAGISVTVTTAKLTTGGVNGSQTFVGGILTAQTQAT